MSWETSTVVASAARTATGNSGAIGAPVGSKFNLGVVVTAASGTTPSMVVSIDWSWDGTTFGAGEAATTSFAAITAAKSTQESVTVQAPFYRVTWTITGTTPSFTFSVFQQAS